MADRIPEPPRRLFGAEGEIPGVWITSREIYDAVIRLTGRVDVLIAEQTGASDKIQDHEVRLRGLERRQWPLPSLALLVSIGALAAAVLIK